MSIYAKPIYTEEPTAEALARHRRLMVHQFKNDLSLLTSVVRLNASRSATEDAKSILFRIERRIQALTCFYSPPCDGDSLESVGILALVSRLLDTILIPGHLDEKLHYTVRTDVHDTLLSRAQAQPLFLLIHELISDYFVKDCERSDPLECLIEHRRGELIVSLERRHITSEVSQYSPSIIVQAFVMQLDATMQETSDEKVRAILVRCDLE